MNLHVGTSGYSYKPWKGSFYPDDLPEKKFLEYYSQQFRTVEINYTFRQMLTVKLLEGWAGRVPAEFQFVLKAPDRITHKKRLKDASELVTQLFEVSGTLKKRLGPILFQLPPNMKKDAARLGEFLKLLPKKGRAAFEFRHQSWFDDEVFTLMHKHKVALCVAEAEDDLDVPRLATADWGYLRLRRPDYSDEELRDWLIWMRDQDWAEAYVFFKHEDEGKGPQMAKRLLALAK
jgi:uncharacterized protein YecE (DUF72 family)